MSLATLKLPTSTAFEYLLPLLLLVIDSSGFGGRRPLNHARGCAPIPYRDSVAQRPAALPMLELFSRDGALWDEKGNRVQLRGVNYFGEIGQQAPALARVSSAPLRSTRRSLTTPSLPSRLSQPPKYKKTPQASRPPTLPRTGSGPTSPSSRSSTRSQALSAASTPSACPSRASSRSTWPPAAQQTSTMAPTHSWKG